MGDLTTLEKTRLGRLLTYKGIIDEHQLRVALRIQRESGQRLGEILIEWGAINQRQLNRLLRKQQYHRWVAAAVACFVPIVPHFAYAGAAGALGSSSSASASISLTIPSKLKVSNLSDMVFDNKDQNSFSEPVCISGEGVTAYHISAQGSGDYGKYTLANKSGDTIEYDVSFKNSLFGRSKGRSLNADASPYQVPTSEYNCGGQDTSAISVNFNQQNRRLVNQGNFSGVLTVTIAVE